MVGYWKGWDTVNCLNQSEDTQSGCEKLVWAKPNLYPLITQEWVVVTILEPIYQSQPSPTIHYTYGERMEWLRCCEILESIQTYSIFVWNVGCWSQHRHHPQLKSQGVVLVVDDEFKSQPCKTIHYTYNETLEGLRCCELPESVQTHSILVWKVGKGQAISDPTCMTEKHVVVTISDLMQQSQPSPTIHYTLS